MILLSIESLKIEYLRGTKIERILGKSGEEGTRNATRFRFCSPLQTNETNSIARAQFPESIFNLEYKLLLGVVAYGLQS